MPVWHGAFTGLRQWEIGPQADLFSSAPTMRLKKNEKLFPYPLVSSRIPEPDSLLAGCFPWPSSFLF